MSVAYEEKHSNHGSLEDAIYAEEGKHGTIEPTDDAIAVSICTFFFILLPHTLSLVLGSDRRHRLG
jgi:hypothetical protein